jgi:hypothetical protein
MASRCRSRLELAFTIGSEFELHERTPSPGVRFAFSTRSRVAALFFSSIDGTALKKRNTNVFGQLYLHIVH